MPNGITMHGVQAPLLHQLDHGRIEIDPVGVDAALAQKGQPLATARTDVEHLAASLSRLRIGKVDLEPLPDRRFR